MKLEPLTKSEAIDLQDTLHTFIGARGNINLNYFAPGFPKVP